ncbi:Acetylxylan esterase [Labilithrix luteola]|uniref:Acetylxylan esterase n=1 Tax=Labilithrix luteola TaxID=1391654 RepID=A0A0K1PSP4_9BACT|nr:Acetylxylan esterase [Labilithrix luteola]
MRPLGLRFVFVPSLVGLVVGCSSGDTPLAGAREPSPSAPEIPAPSETTPTPSPTDAGHAPTDEELDTPVQDLTKPAVQFIGRFDTSDPAGHACGWPGCRIVANFEGTEVSASFNEKVDEWMIGGPSEWDVIIDGNLLPKLVLGYGTQKDVLATNPPSGLHTVELYKRSEAQADPVDTKSTYVLSSFIPKVIVSMIGGLDFAVGLPNDDGPEPVSDFASAYSEFVATLRKNYPHAEILCVVSPSAVDVDAEHPIRDDLVQGSHGRGKGPEREGRPTRQPRRAAHRDVRRVDRMRGSRQPGVSPASRESARRRRAIEDRLGVKTPPMNSAADRKDTRPRWYARCTARGHGDPHDHAARRRCAVRQVHSGTPCPAVFVARNTRAIDTPGRAFLGHVAGGSDCGDLGRTRSVHRRADVSDDTGGSPRAALRRWSPCGYRDGVDVIDERLPLLKCLTRGGAPREDRHFGKGTRGVGVHPRETHTEGTSTATAMWGR